MQKILITVSVIALSTVPAVFANENQNLQQHWGETGAVVPEIIEEVSTQTKNGFQELKSFVFNDDKDNLEITTINFDVDSKAENIIGQAVYNLDERVGTVHDIILDSDGRAVMAIIADGEIFGLGKLVAVEYSRLADHQIVDSFLMSLSEETIDQIAAFSYERDDADPGMQVIPQNGFSIRNLLDSDLTNRNGVAIAEVDDVYLDDGKASHLIIDFDEIYYDETVAVEFDVAEIVHDNDDYNFQLLSPKELQLENFKNTLRGS